MPDSLNPASPVDAQSQPMSRWDAYWTAGFIKPYDFVMLAVCLIKLTVLAAWSTFGQPNVLHVLVALLVLIIWIQFWIISLVFRCSDFVLNVHADIHLLPVEAARIVSAYAGSGSKMPPPAA